MGKITHLLFPCLLELASRMISAIQKTPSSYHIIIRGSSLKPIWKRDFISRGTRSLLSMNLHIENHNTENNSIENHLGTRTLTIQGILREESRLYRPHQLAMKLTTQEMT